MINLPNPVGNVKAKVFKERKIYQGSLPPDLDIKYSFLQELLIKTVKVISDDNCRGYLISLKDNFNIKCLNELVNLSIASLSFPTLFMQYFFLKKYSDRIQELISILDIKEKTDRTIKVLGELYKQLSTWEDLINQYDIAKDQRQTQKKVKDIYIQLKNMFEKSTDEKKQQVEIFKKNLKGKKVPKHIQKIIDEEISKYLLNDKYSMESNVIRNYLEMLTSLPYGITTKENMDLSKAKQVLDETHYGMDDVKERILESIAVSKLKGKSQGKIAKNLKKVKVCENCTNKKRTIELHVEAMVLWRDAVVILHLILCFHSRKIGSEMTKNDGVNIITTAYKISRI